MRLRRAPNANTEAAVVAITVVEVAAVEAVIMAAEVATVAVDEVDEVDAVDTEVAAIITDVTVVTAVITDPKTSLPVNPAATKPRLRPVPAVNTRKEAAADGPAERAADDPEDGPAARVEKAVNRACALNAARPQNKNNA